MAELRFFTNFKVAGNCAVCKQRIESIARSIVGVSSATWDQSTQQISIEYDHTLVTPPKLKAQIASQGHDTDEIKSPDEIYALLPPTCKYRPDDS